MTTHNVKLPNLLSVQIRNNRKFRPEIELSMSQWFELSSLCLLNLLGRCRSADAAIACGCSREVVEIYRRILRGFDVSGGW
jgi:hypothetical protein